MRPDETAKLAKELREQLSEMQWQGQDIDPDDADVMLLAAYAFGQQTALMLYDRLDEMCEQR